MVKKNSTLLIFLSTVAILIIIGLIFIYSASSVFALEKFGSPHYFVQKQIMGLFLGFIGLCFCYKFPLKLLKKYTPLLFWVALGLTAFTLVPGFASRIHGSYRWLSVAGFSFQPSELLKIVTILYSALFLAKKEHYLSSFWYGYFPFLCIISFVAFVLIKQPDFGQAITLSVTVFILLFIAQCRLKHLLLTIVPVIPLIALLIYIKPYRFKRILTFMNPWEDRQGAGFQIIQSLIAIGSGNFWGVGIGQSKQKFFYLPMQHTDFIFSIIAEETGFFGSSLLIMLYIIFLYTGYRLAWHLKDTFCFFTVTGCVTLMSLQTIINFFVTTGLVPTKGIGLPLVSYGNSALIGSLCMIGIIMNCVKNEKA